MIPWKKISFFLRKKGKRELSRSIDREKRNALNPDMLREIDRVLDMIAVDDDVRVVVFTGVGPTFIAGADIDNLLSNDLIEGWFASKNTQAIFDKLEKLGKPSIAAINGAALGGGLELALSCTIRLASADAKMGFPELSLGILPGFGGTQRIIRAAGYAKAAEMLLMSSVVNAEEAKRIGLVNNVVPVGEALGAAKDMAQKIAAVSPVAVRFALELLLRGQNTGFETGLAMESALACLTLASPQAKELLKKFVEKKKG